MDANKKPRSNSAADAWMADGLQFACTTCGDCCTGAPGYVWLNKREIAELAAAMEQTVDEFEADYVRPVGVRKSLAEHANGDCVLLDPQSRKCRAYAARPRQCRTWPFWDSNLKSAEAWAEACEACPGAGKGRLYSLEEVTAARRVIRV